MGRLGTLSALFEPLAWLGRFQIRLVAHFVEVSQLAAKAFFLMFQSRPRFKLCVEQVFTMGLSSMLLVVVTGMFTGAVFAAQMYFAVSNFGLKTTVGAFASLTICRELGPVLGGLMISGRVGSAMVAQIGNMKSTQQIDALHCMGVNPIEYLVVPRLTSMLITAPILIAMTMGWGIVASHLIAVYLLDIPSEWYRYQTWVNTDIPDLTIGIIKGVLFGVIIVIVSCHQGLNASGGTNSVSRAIQNAVVTSAIWIVISNLFLSLILNQIFPLELKVY